MFSAANLVRNLRLVNMAIQLYDYVGWLVTRGERKSPLAIAYARELVNTIIAEGRGTFVEDAVRPYGLWDTPEDDDDAQEQWLNELYETAEAIAFAASNVHVKPPKELSLVN